ncbi:hypothetical protein ACOSP7_032573 [Xanthoceras sorbifolium]
MAKIQTRRCRGRKMSNRARSVYLDNSHPAYGCLLPGWLVEERHMDRGRIYRNPVGFFFEEPSGFERKTQLGSSKNPLGSNE